MIFIHQAWCNTAVEQMVLHPLGLTVQGKLTNNANDGLPE